MPTGHNDLWASENKTIRNSKFLYESSFDSNCIDARVYFIHIFTVYAMSLYVVIL